MRSEPLGPWPSEGTDEEQAQWAEELAKRVEWWQFELPLLGLAQFRIERVSLVDQPHDKDDAAAGVYTSEHYDTCHFEFANGYFTELSPQEQDEMIVHEWLHVLFQDIVSVHMMVDGHMSNAAQDIWDAALKHAEERVIERLARQIVAKVVH